MPGIGKDVISQLPAELDLTLLLVGGIGSNDHILANNHRDKEIWEGSCDSPILFRIEFALSKWGYYKFRSGNYVLFRTLFHFHPSRLSRLSLSTEVGHLLLNHL